MYAGCGPLSVEQTNNVTEGMGCPGEFSESRIVPPSRIDHFLLLMFEVYCFGGNIISRLNQRCISGTGDSWNRAKRSWICSFRTSIWAMRA
jgi:hypothetical protein